MKLLRKRATPRNCGTREPRARLKDLQHTVCQSGNISGLAQAAILPVYDDFVRPSDASGDNR
jgi:hypothetical protein